MDLDSEGLDVIGAVSSARKVTQIELNLIPTVVQPHGHCANEWLYSGSRLQKEKGSGA